MKKMTEDQIPAFVEAVAATGCDITAIGDDLYTIGDADLSEEAYAVAAPQLVEIGQLFGSRDHLILEIVAYLNSIGRSYPPPQTH